MASTEHKQNCVTSEPTFVKAVVVKRLLHNHITLLISLIIKLGKKKTKTVMLYRNTTKLFLGT